VIEEGPNPDRHGVVRWQLKDLVAWVYPRFGVSLDESTLIRTVEQMGFAKLPVRPCHHEPDPAVLTAFKKPVRCCKRDSRGPAAWNDYRAVVPGRDPRWPEKPPATSMGAPRDAALGTQGSSCGLVLQPGFARLRQFG